MSEKSAWREGAERLAAGLLAPGRRIRAQGEWRTIASVQAGDRGRYLYLSCSDETVWLTAPGTEWWVQS